MIEVIYKEENPDIQEGEEGFCLPRNIRQIGVAGEKYKIYMEDYVYTFLIRLARTEENQEVQKGRVAVLTGEIKWKTGTAYLFIRGAVMAEDMEAAVDHVDFSVQVWKQIHEDQKKYFEDQEIVGWFFSQPRISMEATELLEKVHLKHFGGEKVLMLMEPQESEDAFFRYENNTMIRAWLDQMTEVTLGSDAFFPFSRTDFICIMRKIPVCKIIWWRKTRSFSRI